MNKLNHVAFIMDGNGRWGLKRKKGRNFGHLNGVKTVRKIVESSELIKNVLKKKNTIFWCGNGGSAADSQHLSAELVGRFKLNECLKDPLILKEYFAENKDSYDTFLVQELIKGFKKHGEIKMYWINGEYSYCVNTPGASNPGEDYNVKLVKNKKVLDECKAIGEKTLNALPKIKVGTARTIRIIVTNDEDGIPIDSLRSPTKYICLTTRI